MDALNTRELIVVDAAVADWKVLSAGLSPDIPVILLPEGGNGLEALEQALSSYGQIDALHLVSHGGIGRLNLGDLQLTSSTLATNAETLLKIATHFSSESDLLLYGCSVALGSEGLGFVKALSQSLNGVDIAASTDRTGPLTLGGDWDLEYAYGEIETVLPFTVQGMQGIDECLGCSKPAFTTSLTCSGNGGIWTNNTAPTISLANTSQSYTENASAIQIDSAGTVNDTDGNADWNGGKLAVQITSGNIATDQISISDTDGDGIAITITGTNIFANGTDVGDLSASGGTVTNGTKLTITFNGIATNAIVQETLQSIRYLNTGDDPGSTNRVVTVTATDKNSVSASDTRTIAVTPVNDAPTDIALSASTASTFDASNYVVGTFSSTDVDTGDTHTYSLVPGIGDTNNGIFNINSNQLRLTNPSVLTAGTYSARICTTDNGTGNLTYEEAFTITVTDSLIVNTNSDVGDDALTGGSYAAELADGAGLSLREALVLASVGNKTIGFAAGLTGQTITLGSAATVAAGTTFDVDTAGTLTISGSSLSLPGALNLTNGAGDLLTIGSTLAGAGSIAKTGAGTLILSGANTYSGTTAVSGGTLQTNSLGSTSGLTLDGGALKTNGSPLSYSNAVTVGNSGGTTDLSNGSIALSGAISGVGALTINSTAPGNVLSLSGTNTYSGGTVLNGGILQFGSDTAVGSGTLIVNGGKVRASGVTSRTLTNNLVLGGTLTMSGSAALTFTGAVDLGGASRTISNTIASDLTLGGTVSNGSLVVSNPNSGALVLTGINTYGTTSVTAGTLSIERDYNLGSGLVTLNNGSLVLIGSNVTIDNAFSLGASHGTINNANAVTLSGSISGTGNLTKTGAGTLTLSGSNTYGGTTVSAGTFSVGSDSNLGAGQINLANSTIFQVTGATIIDNAIGLTGNATIQSDASVGVSGVISGNFNLAKTGVGTLTLSGTNTYGGTTTVSSGGLSVAADANLGTGQIILATNTTLAITGATTIDNLIELAGNATLQADANATISGVISGSGALAKTGSGTLTLSGNNTYSGNTAVNAGTLLVTGTCNSSGSFDVASGATIGGAGTITAVTVQSGGILAPGSGAGKITTGNLVLDGSLSAELGGVIVGTQYDQVDVVGTVDLSGATLNVSLINAFTPTTGNIFTLINNDGADAITGTFTGLSEGAMISAGGSRFTISYQGGDGNDVVLTALPPNTSPVITSNGGGATAAINVAENTTAVTTVAATDADAGQTVTYSITGGADQAKFSINTNSGALVFASAPNFEAPTDTGSNNTYEVIVQANDGNGGTDSQTITATVTDVNESATPPPTPPPSPDPTPTPNPVIPPKNEWGNLPDNDNDGVPEVVEGFVPGLTGGVTGDGNGDGVQDQLQSSVSSFPFLKTPTPDSNPGNAPSVFVTIVGGSDGGKIDSGSSPVSFKNIQQLDAPTDLPENVEMPLGMISFTADIETPGSSENFSIFVDENIAINGYWKQNQEGAWVNLASPEYGGQIVTEGGKTRLDFAILDGGEFDNDGEADGVITDPGAPGWRDIALAFDENYYLESKLQELRADGLTQYVDIRQVKGVI
ncbi:DUF4347 domain-containing protein, partial [Desulforegula conservatrix]|uniref:DUF4347 domain-containing protein n=1 Tax=Desulforegula conservatrix TaxID=153026 RepID=UPI00047F2DE4